MTPTPDQPLQPQDATRKIYLEVTVPKETKPTAVAIAVHALLQVHLSPDADVRVAESERERLAAELVEAGPKDLEPDNYDDGFCEGVNDANIRWRAAITQVITKGPEGKA